MARLIAVGDIHAQYYMLQDLLHKIKPNEADKFVFLGDYIDRGRYSKKVVDYLLDFDEKYNCVFLRGNHEDMLLDYLELEQKAKYGEAYLSNGGRKTIISYAGKMVNSAEFKNSIPEAHIQFFLNTRDYYIEDNYLFVHAGVAPNKPLEKQNRGDLLWIRDEFIYSPTTKLDKIVVFGHTPNQEVMLMKDKIGIDTGAGYNIHLSALELNSREVFTV